MSITTPTGPAPEHAAATPSRDWVNVAFWALLAVGFGLRILFVFSSDYRMDSDSAVVYLMAKHVADGQFPAFFWGQSYGGTLLSLVAGAVMVVTGPSLTILSIISALFWAGAAVILRAFVTRAIGATAGTIAGVLFWFSGGVILGTSVVDPGFYGPSLVFGLGSMLLVLGTRSPRSIGAWIGIGLLAGLSLWTSPMAIAFSAPAVVYALWTDRRWRLWLLAGVAAVLAALPWIIETVRSRLSSIKPLGGSSIHPESGASLFTAMFPAAFPGGTYELVQFLIALATVGLFLLLLYRGITRKNVGAVLMAAGTVLLLVALVAGTGVRLAGDSVRYSGFLIPGLAMSISWVLARRRILAIAACAIAVVVTTSMVFVRVDGFHLSTPEPFNENLTAVDHYLDDEGIEAAYGSYWAAYALSAESNERPTVAAIIPRRYETYEADAAHKSPMAIVVFAGADNDKALSANASLPSSTRTVFGPYAVFMFRSWFDPYPLNLGLN